MTTVGLQFPTKKAEKTKKSDVLLESEKEVIAENAETGVSEKGE